MLNFLLSRYNKRKYMLSETLADLPVAEKYEDISSSCVFIGAKIKNRYDEKRICINENYTPKRIKVSNNTNLFGITLDPIPEHQEMVVKLKAQKIFDLIGYNILLQEYKLSCNDVYYNLLPPLYPIDNIHINKYIKNFNFEDFICFNLDSAKFQSFYSVNVFFIAGV